MQQVYNRALYSLGPDVGCYAPPMLYEKEQNESLQVKGVRKKRFFFQKSLALLKSFFYSLNLLGVKEKVLGIDPRKILTPVSGL